MMTSKFLITNGDPNGIGPEVLLKSLSDYDLSKVLVISNESILSFWKTHFNLAIELNAIHSISEIDTNFQKDRLNILQVPYFKDVSIGQLDINAGAFSLKCIDTAIQLLKSKYSTTLITCPISKEAIIPNYPSFMGHTEYLAEAFAIPEVTMLLASDRVKVATVTTHIPLSVVANCLNKDKIITTIEHCSEFIKQAQETKPIAVCGLNPHAGEGGQIGDEENYIKEAIITCQTKGIHVEGPFSADTLFTHIHKETYSLYISMYHDQGLIPFKLMSFGEGVNITLGLPIRRISVDHGTAFDIAGKGIADLRSFKKALKLAEV